LVVERQRRRETRRTGATPALRADNALIEYLVSKGRRREGAHQARPTVHMARGLLRPTRYPETVALLTGLGVLLCLRTHFRARGGYCAGSGVPVVRDDEHARRGHGDPLRRRPPT
jgi:hypothetical protein